MSDRSPADFACEGARRRFLAGAGAALLVAAVARPSRAQSDAPRLATPPAPWSLQYAGFLETRRPPGLRIAHGHCDFRPEDGRYALAMKISSPLATLAYESSGVLDEFGLHPRHYRETRRLPLRAPREKSIEFVEGATTSAPGERHAIPFGAQDRLSVLIQMSLLARADPRRARPGAVWKVVFAGFDGVDEVRLQVGDVETVELDGANVRAQRVRRIGTDTAAPTKIDFWMSADADRAPVVIRFEDDDGRALRFVRAG